MNQSPDVTGLPDTLLPRSVRVLLILLSIAAIAAFLFVALSRIGYPYELEFMTGACLDHVDRILAGESMYVAPTVDFVTWLYGPLYFYTAAAVAWLVGTSDLTVLRAVSLAAAVVTTVLVYHTTRRLTRGDTLAGIVGAGLWASTYGIVGTWWDIGRVDSLFVTFTMAALAVAWLGAGRGSAIAAGVLLTCAFMTKQTALVLAPAFVIGVAMHGMARAVVFGAAFALTLVPSIVWLDWQTEGWFWFYAWSVPSSHGYELATWWQYFVTDTLAILPMVLAAGWYVVRLATTRRLRSALAAGAFGGGLWLATNLSRAHVGGAENVVIPTHLGFALLTALALAEARRSRPWHLVIALLALAQFACSAYDPRRYLPTEADRAVGDRLIEVLRESRGPVMLPHHGHYAARAGHPMHAHVLAVMDIERGPDPELGQALRAQFLNYTWDRDVDVLVLDEPTGLAFAPLLARDPTVLEWAHEPLFDEALDSDGLPVLQQNGRPLFMPVVGLQARPKQIWRRQR